MQRNPQKDTQSRWARLVHPVPMRSFREGGSEDCLYLNVFMPEEAQNLTGLPCGSEVGVGARGSCEVGLLGGSMGAKDSVRPWFACRRGAGFGGHLMWPPFGDPCSWRRFFLGGGRGNGAFEFPWLGFENQLRATHEVDQISNLIFRDQCGMGTHQTSRKRGLGRLRVL